MSGSFEPHDDSGSRVVLPVFPGAVALALHHASHGGSGLNVVDGRYWSESDYFLPGHTIESDRKHDFRAVVQYARDEVTVRIDVDGQRLFEFVGAPARLSLWSGFTLNHPGAIALKAQNVDWHELRLEMLDGQAYVPQEMSLQSLRYWRPERVDGPIDLIARADPERDDHQEQWRKQGETLSCTPQRMSGYLLPVKPQGDYRLHATFRRLEGDDMVAFGLPVGQTQVGLILESGAAKSSGLSRVNELPTADPANPTHIPDLHLENGKPYLLDVTVKVPGDQAEITATLNDAPLISWAGPVTALTFDYELFGRRPPGRIGLAARQSRVVFEQLQLTLLNGNIRVPEERPRMSPQLVPGDTVDLIPIASSGLEGYTVINTPVADGMELRSSPPNAFGRLSLPVEPTGAYDVRGSFTRTHGNHFGILLPAGGHRTKLIVAVPRQDGNYTGIAKIDDLGVGEAGHPASKELDIKNERHSFLVRVIPQGDGVSIEVELDGSPFVSWTGSPSRLSVHDLADVPQPNTLGLVVAPGTTVIRHELSLTMRDGSAQPYLPQQD